MAGTAESLLRPLISKKNGAEELGVGGSWVSSSGHGIGDEEVELTLKPLELGARANLIFQFMSQAKHYLAV